MNNIDWLRDVIYILPLAALIWKAAQQNAEMKQLRKDVDANITKFCAEHKELEQAVNHNKVIVDDIFRDIHDKLTLIQVSIAKIEARTETKTDKEDNKE